MTDVFWNRPKKFTDRDVVVRFLISRKMKKKLTSKIKNFENIYRFYLGLGKIAQPGWAIENHLKVVYCRVLRFLCNNCITIIDFMTENYSNCSKWVIRILNESLSILENYYHFTRARKNCPTSNFLDFDHEFYYVAKNLGLFVWKELFLFL